MKWSLGNLAAVLLLSISACGAPSGPEPVVVVFFEGGATTLNQIQEANIVEVARRLSSGSAPVTVSGFAREGEPQTALARSRAEAVRSLLERSGVLSGRLRSELRPPKPASTPAAEASRVVVFSTEQS